MNERMVSETRPRVCLSYTEGIYARLAPTYVCSVIPVHLCASFQGSGRVPEPAHWVAAIMRGCRAYRDPTSLAPNEQRKSFAQEVGIKHERQQISNRMVHLEMNEWGFMSVV